MKKHSFKLEFYFSLIIFAIMAASVLIIAPFFVLAINRGVFKGIDLFISVLLFYVFSMIAAVTVSAIVGKRILNPIRRLSNAAKRVSEGQFDIRLDEKSRVAEISTLLKDFNIMVQELGNEQTLRGDFIANISHEFKTPLASIEGYASLLKDTSLSDEELCEYADRIMAASKKLSKLSGNILKITRLEGQEIVTDKETFRLDEQIRQTILLFEADWQQKNIELDINLDEILYYGNSEILNHIWSNLLSNAFKFSEHDGKVTVQLKKEDGCAVCVIKDTGIGMDSETLNHIFEKFYQAQTPEKDRGNGLGLTLAQRVAQLCGGNITVSSLPDCGSEFTVTLPL